MADRTMAGVFSDIFKMLAELPNKNNKAYARKFAELSLQYDFTTDQMNCDDELCTLGLAKEIPSLYSCKEYEYLF